MGDLLSAPGKQEISASTRDSLDVFRDNPIYAGGDVSISFLSVLHPYGNIKGSQQVCEGVYWQCDLAEAAELIKSGDADPLNFKMVLGYAGWGDKQLEGELKLNSWVLVRDIVVICLCMYTCGNTMV
jgi:putative transcriptional regulator